MNHIYFDIKDGLGKIKIGSTGVGDSFTFIRPLTFCWPDDSGSIGMYLSTLPYSEEYRKEINDSIRLNLDVDFTGKVDELHNLLRPLFRLFPNGSYSLYFYNDVEKDFFKSYIGPSNNNNYTVACVEGWNLSFGKLSDSRNTKEIIKEYRAFLAENAHRNDFYLQTILEYSTSTFWGSGGNGLLATQPEEAINMERVKEFEAQILEGARPFVIVYSCFLEDTKEVIENGRSITHNDSIYSEHFVIDGHHKLLAYKNLGLYPPIASIQFLPKDRSEIRLDFAELEKYMYGWQLNHIRTVDFDNRCSIDS